MEYQNIKLNLPKQTEQDLIRNQEGFMTPRQVTELQELLKYSIPLKFISVFSKNLIFGLLIGLVVTYARRNSINNLTEFIVSVLWIGTVISFVGYLSFRVWLEFDAGSLLVREAIQ
jgi:hypothetical protein